MPVYEYACGKCGHEFEAEQRITEPPLKTCPRCRARKLKRLISQTSFVLKGSGWYADLYSSKAKPETETPRTRSPTRPPRSPRRPATARPPQPTSGDGAAPPSDPKPKKKREGKPGKSKGSKAAA